MPGACMVCFRNSKEAKPVERSEQGPESVMGSERQRQRGDRKSRWRLIGHCQDLSLGVRDRYWRDGSSSCLKGNSFG